MEKLKTLFERSKLIETTCRNDIATLNQFAKINKNMSVDIQRIIRKRLAKAHFQLGYSFYEQNQIQEARSQFLKSISSWPFLYWKKYFYLATTYLNKRRGR